MVTDISDKNGPPKPVARWWQFSLRETIFATAAIAAIVAVMMQNQARQTSAMAQSFAPAATLTQVIKDNNLPGRAFKSGGSGSMGPSSISHDFRIRFIDVSEADVRAVIMPAFMAEMKAAILAEGYEISASSIGGNRNKQTQDWDSVGKFSFGYSGLEVSGHLRVLTSYDKKGEPTLIITLDEL